VTDPNPEYTAALERRLNELAHYKHSYHVMRGERDKAEAENARLMRLLDKPFLEKLAELEAENKLLTRHNEGWRGKWMDQKQRAEKAEAENVRLRDYISLSCDAPCPDVCKTFRDLDAENARLRVCGSCGHFRNVEFEMCDIPNEYSVDPEYVGAQDPCRFDPPRWTPYWEEA